MTLLGSLRWSPRQKGPVPRGGALGKHRRTAGAVALGGLYVACAGATHPPERAGRAALGGGRDAADFVDALADAPADLEAPLDAAGDRDSGDVVVVRRQRVCLDVERVCPAAYSTAFRLAGTFAELHAAVLTVCHNGRCHSNALAPLLDAVRAPHWGNQRTLWFPPARVGDWSPPGHGKGRPLVSLAIMTDAVTKGGCDPWCEVGLTFELEPGDAKKEGDVYEVRFGRAGDSSDTAEIRDAVRYQTEEMDSCKTCTFSLADHRGDAPVVVG